MQILIADDEAPARSRLRRMIGELAAGEIVGEAASGREVLALAASRRPTSCCSTSACPKATASRWPAV